MDTIDYKVVVKDLVETARQLTNTVDKYTWIKLNEDIYSMPGPSSITIICIDIRLTVGGVVYKTRGEVRAERNDVANNMVREVTNQLYKKLLIDFILREPAFVPDENGALIPNPFVNKKENDNRRGTREM